MSVRKKEKNITFLKNGTSNLLVDKTKSVVKLIIFVLLFLVKAEFPNSNV